MDNPTSNRILVCVVSVFLVLTARDLLSARGQQKGGAQEQVDSSIDPHADLDGNIKKTIPPSKLYQFATGHHIRIDYCSACGGYRRLYEEYEAILREKFPSMRIEGRAHGPEGAPYILAKIVMVLKFVFIGLIMSGHPNPFRLLGYMLGRQIDLPPPQFWLWCLEHKVYATLFVFFFCNMFESSLHSTGAFEVWVNNQLIWSKIATGKIPQPPELFSLIESHTGIFGNLEPGSDMGHGPDISKANLKEALF